VREPRRAKGRTLLAAGAVLAVAGGGLSWMTGPYPQAQGDVPAPTPTSSVITVQVGGIRDQATDAVQPVEGVVLQLFDGSSASGPGVRINEPWAQCVSDSDGDCSFIVPQTGTPASSNPNRDRRFWIRQDGMQAPASTGYFHTNPVVTSTNGSTFVSTDYQARTGPQLRAGSTYTSHSDFMANAGTPYISSGIWPESVNNPPFPSKCGLDVALVMDLSGSVFEFQGGFQALRAAGVAMTDALVGTPSQVAVYTFGSLAPAPGSTNINRPLSPVSTSEGADTVKGWINGLAQPNPGQATNWDRGLYQVAKSASDFDVVVVLTDGEPTRYGPFGSSTVSPMGTGIQTRFIEIEQAIFSANAVKAKGTRIIAVGLGDGVAGPGFNLAAISGPSNRQNDPRDNDYYQADWNQAATVLRSVALAGCAGSVTVVKQVVPPDNASGVTTGAVPAGNWDFAITATGATVSPATLTTAPGTGAASAGFTGITSGTATLTITEDPNTGYAVFPVGNQNAQCTRLSGPNAGQAVAVTDAGPSGFSLDVGPQDAVSCTVYNKPIPQTPLPASLVITKKWVLRQVNGNNEDLRDAELFDDGGQPLEFSAGLSTTIETIPHPGMSWGVTYGGFLAGNRGTLMEDPGLTFPPGCTVGVAQVTRFKLGDADWVNVQSPPPIAQTGYDFTLAAGLNQFEVTNTVACRTELTLYKAVADQTVDTTQWTLTAKGDQSSLPGPSGTFDQTVPGNTQNTHAFITPGAEYILSESGGSPFYSQYQIPLDPETPPVSGSTGSWVCYLEDPIQGPGVPSVWLNSGLYGSVTVPWGGHAQCIAVNYTASLTVYKVVTGGTADETAWTFSAIPTADAAPATPELRGFRAFNEVNITPNQPYTISEDSTGPSGYALREFYCVWDDPQGDVHDATFSGNATITLGYGATGLCEATNDPLTEIALTKSSSLAGATVPGRGTRFDYLLTVVNSGEFPAAKVEVRDSVPTSLRIVSVTAPGDGWVDNSTESTVSLTRETMEVGSVVVRVTVEVIETLPRDVDLVNSACVSATNDTNPDNNCGTTTIPREPHTGPPVTPPPNTITTPPASPTAPTTPPGTTPPGTPPGTTPPGATPPGTTPAAPPKQPAPDPPGDDPDDPDDVGSSAATGAPGLQSLGSSAMGALLTGAALLLVRRRLSMR
jgi:uncharacterized repeat protein (TIGR01451 family)